MPQNIKKPDLTQERMNSADSAIYSDRIGENNLILKERKRWLFFGIPWTFTKYSIWTKKLVIEQGLFKSVESEILLYRIVDMTYSRTLFQKIFKLGTIVVYAHDKTTPVVTIKNIKHSRQYKEKLSEMVEKDRLRMKMRQSEFVDAGMPDFNDHDDDGGIF